MTHACIRMLITPGGWGAQAGRQGGWAGWPSHFILGEAAQVRESCLASSFEGRKFESQRCHFLL